MTRLLSPCLLVASAHDPLGRRVVELLLRRDEAEVIATSRQPVHLVDLAARVARIRGADRQAFCHGTCANGWRRRLGGVTVSNVRFYEAERLIHATRTAGNQCLYGPVSSTYASFK